MVLVLLDCVGSATDISLARQVIWGTYQAQILICSIPLRPIHIQVKVKAHIKVEPHLQIRPSVANAWFTTLAVANAHLPRRTIHEQRQPNPVRYNLLYSRRDQPLL